MSKKSRRRNKKILAVLGALGGAALMARGKRNASIEANEAKESGFDIPAVTSTSTTIMDNMPKKKPKISTSKIVAPKTTIMDSMPARPKLNEKSIRVKNGKVFTIADAKKGIKPKIAGIDTPSIYVRDDGRITAGGKQYLNKAQYASRNKKPAMLGDNFYKKPRVKSDMEEYVDQNPFKVSAKKGGRIVKGKKTAVRTGAAKRGFGRAYMKGRK